MRRVASRPSITGMRTSIRITSGSSSSREPDRLGAVCGLADHGQIGLRGEQRAEALAHHRLVVGDQAGDRAAGHDAASVSGSTAETAKPPTVFGSAEIEPPRIATRSRMPAMPCPGRPVLERTRRPSSAGR